MNSEMVPFSKITSKLLLAFQPQRNNTPFKLWQSNKEGVSVQRWTVSLFSNTVIYWTLTPSFFDCQIVLCFSALEEYCTFNNLTVKKGRSQSPIINSVTEKWHSPSLDRDSPFLTGAEKPATALMWFWRRGPIFTFSHDVAALSFTMSRERSSIVVMKGAESEIRYNIEPECFQRWSPKCQKRTFQKI